MLFVFISGYFIWNWDKFHIIEEYNYIIVLQIVVCYIFNCICLWTYLLTGSNTCVFFMVQSLAFIKIMYIKFSQAYTLALEMSRFGFSSNRFAYFHTKYTQTLA